MMTWLTAILCRLGIHWYQEHSRTERGFPKFTAHEKCRWCAKKRDRDGNEWDQMRGI